MPDCKRAIVAIEAVRNVLSEHFSPLQWWNCIKHRRRFMPFRFYRNVLAVHLRRQYIPVKHHRATAIRL